MKKEEYSYGIIYKNLKNKKEAINQIEGICPCCGNDTDLIKEEYITNIYKQTIYECNCGTKWRGNCYNKNEEIIEYKEIKKLKTIKKIEDFFENIDIEILLPVCLALIASVILLLFIINCIYNTEITEQTNKQLYYEKLTELQLKEKEIDYKLKELELKEEKNNLKEIDTQKNIEKEEIKDNLTEENKETIPAEYASEIEKLYEIMKKIISFMTPIWIIIFVTTVMKIIFGPRY